MAKASSETRPAGLLYWPTWVVLVLVRGLAFMGGWGILVPLATLNLEIYPEYSILFGKLAAAAGGKGPLALAGAGLVLLSWLARDVLLRMKQRRMDGIAATTMERLRRDPGASHRPFFLYLRAFETTGRLDVPLYLRLQRMGVRLGWLRTNDVESYVSSAVGKLAPLIALGRPGESVGAGRILADDDDWQRDLLVLLDECKAVLMVPSHRPGTAWEIETIRQRGLLEKCVFIMPPHAKKAEFDSRDRWQRARQKMAEFGLEAPEYQDRGLLFVLGADGKVSEVEPILLGSMRQIRKSLRRLLDDRPPEGGLLAAVARVDRRRRRAALLGWSKAAYAWSPFFLAALSVFFPGVPLERKDEPWSLVVDRVANHRTLSRYALFESLVLRRSERYRQWADRLSETEYTEEKAELRTLGLFRLEDAELLDYYVGWSEMLDRLDTASCAAMLSGEFADDILTYMPPARLQVFLEAQTDALLASVEERPLPEFDDQGIDVALARFLEQLTASGELASWQRINEGGEVRSDDEACWFVRTLFGGVRRLEPPHAAAWARYLAALAIADEPESG